MIIGKRRTAVKQLRLASPLRSRRRVKQRLQHITTFVVDSSSLVRDRYDFDATWSLSMHKENIVLAAHNALTATDNPELLLLKKSLPPTKITVHTAVNSGNKKISWSTWHHGGDYETFWCGDITTMLHYANLTDTDREHIMLEARKAISRGLIAYAVGSSTSATLPTNPSHTIEQLSLIFVKPIMYSGVETTLQQIHKQGISVVYISSDDTYTTTAIAHLTGLATTNDIAVSLTPSRIARMQTKLYASATPVLRQRLVDSYPVDSIAEVTGSLPEFWRNFRKALS